jgi:transposase
LHKSRDDPHCLDDYVTENNPVRVIEAFIDELDLARLGFDGVVPEITGRPVYHPAMLLKTISTAISTVSRRAGAWSGRPSVTSN